MHNMRKFSEYYFYTMGMTLYEIAMIDGAIIAFRELYCSLIEI